MQLTRLILGMLAFAGFVVWANGEIQGLVRDLDAADASLDRCEVALADAGRQVARLVRDRDLAVRRAEDSAHLMRSASAARSEGAFALLRASDAVRQLRDENARLSAEAEARSAPSATASATAAKPAAGQRPKKRKKAAARKPAKQQAGWHGWVW